MIRFLTAPNWIWPLLAGLSAAALLAGAHAFEHFGGLPVCPLCYRQREIHWAVLAMAVTGLVLWRIRPTIRFMASLNIMLGLVFLVSMVVAGYHAGVEWGVFPGPDTCSVADLPASDVGGGGLLASLERGDSAISCGDAAWRMFGISMAGYNALISTGLALVSFVAAAAVWRGVGQKDRRELAA